MKINNAYQDSNIGGTQGADRAQETAAAGGTRTARAAGQVSSKDDEVSLSSLASVLQSATAETPERAAYLEKLSADFEAGKAGGDPEAIARAILDDELLDGPQGR